MKKLILLVLAVLIVLPAVYAVVNVQTIAGKQYTGVLVNGAVNRKFNIVFIGDGFRSQDQAKFNARVDDAVNALRALAPYSTNMCGFNIWRVNVVSVDSGVDHPMQSISRNTELDCRYGNVSAGEAERCITTNSPAKCFEAAGHAPGADAVFTLVNDVQWGGCAGSLVFSSISPGFAGIITHELGHKISALADEYDCYNCVNDNNRTYSGAEPGQVNITKNTTRATLKWRDLVLATTALPTTTPLGAVGCWEGGGYYRFAMYRPQSTCHMRTTGSDFCAVCRRKVAADLAGRCTACERDPSSIACIISQLRTQLVAVRRFPFIEPPLCCFCPLFGDWRSRVILDGVDQRFKIDVIDGAGNAIKGAQVATNGKTTEVTYPEQAGTRYGLRISLADGKNVLDAGVTFNARLERNGQAVRLE